MLTQVFLIHLHYCRFPFNWGSCRWWLGSMGKSYGLPLLSACILPWFLGAPWLIRHDPHIPWSQHIITFLTSFFRENCLLSQELKTLETKPRGSPSANQMFPHLVATLLGRETSILHDGSRLSVKYKGLLGCFQKMECTLATPTSCLWLPHWPSAQTHSSIQAYKFYAKPELAAWREHLQ